MPASQQLRVIKRSLRQGESIDVAGLNVITVLVDRSQTALTEIGLNEWRAGLEGPPHFHDAKEQIFFVVGGSGKVIVSGETYHVQPNSLVHVPVGAMHQTTADKQGSVAYLLFNAFTDATKEGQGTYAQHLSEAKNDRRKQADDAARGAPVNWLRRPVKGRLLKIELPEPSAIEGTMTTPLLNAKQTYRCAADLLVQSAHTEALLGCRQNAETTLYVIQGGCIAHVGGETWPLTAGDVLYVPPEQAVTTQADGNGCAVLCLSTMLS